MGNIKYLAAFVDWRKTELAKLDRRTWRGFDMNGWLHSRAGIVRLYLSRNEGRRGLISVEVCMELARVDIDSNVYNSEGNLLKAARLTARYRETKNPNEIKS